MKAKEIKNLIHKIRRALIAANCSNKEIKLAESLFWLLHNHKKKFGLFVVFAWKRKWNKKFLDVPDITQDIFLKRRFNVFKLMHRSLREIDKTINFDGAILIDKHGSPIHSGIIFEGLRPSKLADKLKLAPKNADLSTQLGFKKKIHGRHLSAIAVSAECRGTTVYTISEETGDFHIFKNGRIIYSTVRGE